MKNSNLPSGSVVLEEIQSPINGRLQIVQSFEWGNYVLSGGLTQSGGVVVSVWKHTLTRIKKENFHVSNCLILGLGGGSVAGLMKKMWPESKVTGIEIDPLMVDLGIRYLGLCASDVEIEITDALDFCAKKTKEGKKFDLILVDIYIQDEVPERFEDEDFVRTLTNLLEEGGTVVFNRLYFDEKRGKAVRFGKVLEKVFPGVKASYPEANVMFICNR